MTSKLSLRLKLSDFINTELESKIMEKINNIHNELHIAVMLYLWFDEDEINNKDLKEFLMRWEDKLHFRTIVKNTSNVEQYEFVFFDIIPISVPKNEKYRFAYTYINTDKIIDGLNELYACIKFIKLDRPAKRQKRNDYED